jgi:hypothetical protein
LNLGRFFSFLIFYTIDSTPWTGDQPVARPPHAHRTAQTQNKHTQTYMPQVGFEPTIPVFERAKTVHALDRAATEIGNHVHWNLGSTVGLRHQKFFPETLITRNMISVRPCDLRFSRWVNIKRSSQMWCHIVWKVWGARGSVVRWGIMLQAGRSRVRFPMR